MGRYHQYPCYVPPTRPIRASGSGCASSGPCRRDRSILTPTMRHREWARGCELAGLTLTLGAPQTGISLPQVGSAGRRAAAVGEALGLRGHVSEKLTPPTEFGARLRIALAPARDEGARYTCLPFILSAFLITSSSNLASAGLMISSSSAATSASREE